MKLKQLLISTASIAALAVVPMSIVSCGNNNNNAVEDSPSKPGGDNNTSNPGTGDNNNQEPTINYVEVNSKEDMLKYIIENKNIAAEFIKQISPNKQFNETLTSIKWSDKLQSMVPSGMTFIEKDGYFYYNVKTLTFTYSGGPVLTYKYNDKNNQEVTQYVSGHGSANVFVDLHFKSTQKFTSN